MPVHPDSSSHCVPQGRNKHSPEHGGGGFFSTTKGMTVPRTTANVTKVTIGTTMRTILGFIFLVTYIFKRSTIVLVEVHSVGVGVAWDGE